MGFFSWKTQDTNKSISNCYSSRGALPVYMVDDKGNFWHEPDYEGYGVFAGKDYYVLLAEMNGMEGDEDTLRTKGIEIAYNGNSEGTGTQGVKYPNLFEKLENHVYSERGPDNCPNQGYFYR